MVRPADEGLQRATGRLRTQREIKLCPATARPIRSRQTRQRRGHRPDAERDPSCWDLCCKLLFAYLVYFQQKSINSITLCIDCNVSCWRDWFCWSVRCLLSPVWAALSLTSDPWKLPGSFLFINTNVTLRRLSIALFLRGYSEVLTCFPVCFTLAVCTLLYHHHQLHHPVNQAPLKRLWWDKHEVKISFSKKCNMCGTLFFMFFFFNPGY